MPTAISTQRRDAVLSIRLDGTDGNALDNDALAALAGALADAATADCAVVALEGAGPDFCRGRAEPPRDDAGGPPTPRELERLITRPILGVFGALERVPVPVVAAVRGRAWGLGCALAGACDITLAAADASFCLPEMRRNLPPTLAISALHRVVAPKALAELVYRSEEIDGAVAQRLGIVTRVLDSAELDEALSETVQQLSGRDRYALVAVKSSLRSLRTLDAGSAADVASATLAGVLATQAGA